MKNNRIKYPEIKKANTVDNYFGVDIQDPYRWLEDSTSSETKNWTETQNGITEEFLAHIPFRDKVKERLTKLWNHKKASIPIYVAGNYFRFKNDGLEAQDSCYIKRKGSDKYELLIDVKKLSTDGSASIADLYPSKDGKYLAYSISRFGLDWREFFIIDLATGKQLPDHIQWVKFAGLEWYKDGFFYSSFANQEREESEARKRKRYSRVFYHKIGTDPKEDRLIYKDQDEKVIGSMASVSSDDQYLFLYGFSSTIGNSLAFKKISLKNEPFTTIFSEEGIVFQVIFSDSQSITVFTNFEAPKHKLIKVYLNNPEPENWVELVPEKEHSIEWAYSCGGQIIIQYLKNLDCVLEVHSKDGKYLNTIPLPGIGSVRDYNISCNWNDPEAFIQFESYTIPQTIFKYTIDSNKLEVYDKIQTKFNSENYVTRKIFYNSKDGTKVPMFISHKKDIDINGNVPTLLYGYGGFQNSNLPRYDTSKLFFLEQGGIYAVANIRGGGEYGRDWHQAGTLENKQNVFDDFIAAAEYLIDQKYTNNKKLAITGRSNGGLLVGAVLNQRPDLFKAALPMVGVMDMLRYHKFTVGYAWVSEYGKSDVEEQFKYLIKYSPLHNIQAKQYPATLVLAADHDDRVVPAHSYKYISTLQENQKSEAPVIIRIDTGTGHATGKSTQKSINEWTDIWTFIMYHLDMDYKELPCNK